MGLLSSSCMTSINVVMEAALSKQVCCSCSAFDLIRIDIPLYVYFPSLCLQKNTMASQSLPPFPSDLPTAGLVSVPLHALESSPPSSDECSKLFTASRELGFFYLDLIGSELGESILCEVERLYALQQEFYALPHEVKDQYGMDKIDDPFYSYRWTQCKEGVKDVWGRSGRREMYNVSKAHGILIVNASLTASFADTRR